MSDLLKFLTVEQASSLLNVKRSWLYARCADEATGCEKNPIPVIRHRGLIRFDREKLLAWWYG